MGVEPISAALQVVSHPSKKIKDLSGTTVSHHMGSVERAFSSGFRYRLLPFFHYLTSTECTSYACAISLIVLTPHTTSSPTLSLNSGVCTLRILPSLIRHHPFEDDSLNYRLKF
jgi:hypothetical protein